MHARTAQLLEFAKILGHLAAFAVSDAGRQACMSILPAQGLDQVTARGRETREVLHLAAHVDLRLSPFPDISGVLEFLDNPLAELDADGLLGVRDMLVTAFHVREILAGLSAETYPLLAELGGRLALPGKAWAALQRCLSPDGVLRDEASPELYAVRQEIRHVHQACTRKVQDFFVERELRFILQDDYLTISADRYVLAVKSNFKGRMKGIVHDYSQTGETCYVEPLFLVELNNDLQEWRQQERVEEQKVLRFLTGLIRSEREVLERAFAALVRVDVLWAMQGFAKKTDGRVVDVQSGAALRLVQARHPMLIFSAEHVVPVDIELLKGQRALIITGGNAGGKTVCLKTLGLLALMAHAGMPIPVAEGSSLPFWDTVVVSMGDEQSIEENLSTFTAQIRHFSEVWPRIDSRSLVILDEFGVGTDPAQGAALAQAVVDGLLDRGAWVGAVTHFPALKAYGLSREGVRAASVIFSPDDHRPLFRLGYDQVGASRALDVAKAQGLPEEILLRAREYLYPDAGEAEEIFDRLNRLAAEKEAELAAQRDQAGILEKKYAEKCARLDRERTRVQTELRDASRCIMHEWRAGRKSRKDALKELAVMRESLSMTSGPEDEGEKLSVQAIAEGQKLFYLPWNKPGVVLEVDARKGRVRLDMGGIFLWVGMGDVQTREDQPVRKVRGGGVVVRGTGGASVPLKLDVRGLRVDEAEAEVAKFLDKALLAGRQDVEIVHGMGTGAVRRAVHEHLRHSRAVSSFALANAGEGGDGLTKVVLAG